MEQHPCTPLVLMLKRKKIDLTLFILYSAMDLPIGVDNSWYYEWTLEASCNGWQLVILLFRGLSMCVACISFNAWHSQVLSHIPWKYHWICCFNFKTVKKLSASAMKIILALWLCWALIANSSSTYHDWPLWAVILIGIVVGLVKIIYMGSGSVVLNDNRDISVPPCRWWTGTQVLIWIQDINYNDFNLNWWDLTQKPCISSEQK